MTEDNWKKKYEEALERMKYVVVVPANEAALQAVKETVFPELRKSEEEKINKCKESLHVSKTCKENANSFTDKDERVRKLVINRVRTATEMTDSLRELLLTYLEKQKSKERLDRMAPIYNDKESFESALEKAWKYYNESASRTVDSFEDDYIECVFSKGFREGFLYKEKQKEQIPYTDFVIKPHKGDNTNPYDMSASEAQEYTIKRGFGIPFNDGEVYIDERHMTQTIGNILRWADEHPKEQKPSIFPPGLGEVHFNPISCEQKPILEVFGFKVGDAVRLKDGDGRKHIIKSFEGVEGIHGPNFYRVEFEDDSARDGIYPDEKYPNGYYTQMEKIEEKQKHAEWSEKHIADIFEKVGLAKIAREQGNDELTNAVQSAMIELSKTGTADEQFPPLEGLDAIKAKYYDDGFKNGFDEGVESVKPAEWNKEDERKITRLIDYFESFRIAGVATKWEGLDIQEVITLLKSLRPNPHWKPSEEQMEALRVYLYHPQYINNSEDVKIKLVESLYNDLQKLM